MTTRIGIAGITGRMGKLLTEEVAAAGASMAGGTSRANPTLRRWRRNPMSSSISPMRPPSRRPPR